MDARTALNRFGKATSVLTLLIAVVCTLMPFVSPTVTLLRPPGAKAPSGASEVTNIVVSIADMSFLDRFMVALPWLPTVAVLLAYSWIFAHTDNGLLAAGDRIPPAAKITTVSIFCYLASLAGAIAGYKYYFDRRFEVGVEVPFSMIGLSLQLVFVIMVSMFVIMFSIVGSDQLNRADQLDNQLKNVV